MTDSAHSGDIVSQLTARVQHLEAVLQIKSAETSDDKASDTTQSIVNPTGRERAFSHDSVEAPQQGASAEFSPVPLPATTLANSIPTLSVSLPQHASLNQALHMIPTPSVSVSKLNVPLNVNPPTNLPFIPVKQEAKNMDLPPIQPKLLSAVPTSTIRPVPPPPRTSSAKPNNASQQPPNYQELMYPTGASKQCSCKKSRCLKLYCECFAANVFCKDCKCSDCQNVPEHAEVRMRAIQYKLSRRPRAFQPKFTAKAEQKTEEMRHSRGCNCKKSGCNKRYCECYQNGVACSTACKCSECKNSAVAPLPSTVPRRAPDSVKKGFLSWRIPLSADVVNAMGTKSCIVRKEFPADFIPGEKPSFTFAPYGGIEPSMDTPPSSTSSQPPEPSRKRRRDSRRVPVEEQSSSKRRSTRVKSRSTRHCRVSSREDPMVSPLLGPLSADGSDSFYSCSNSEDSDLEMELMETDPELTAALFDAAEAGTVTASTVPEEVPAEDSGLWLTEDFSTAPSVSFQSLSDSTPDVNWALQDARKGMQSTEHTVGEAKPMIDEDFCMDDIQFLERPGDLQLATEPSTDTLANSSSTLCEPIDEDWIVSDSMFSEVVCPGSTGCNPTVILDEKCDAFYHKDVCDSFCRKDSSDSFFSGLVA